ncbi:MAG: CPBP family intramembrane metalloprotease [Bacteroides sp.]|nr:CPBP family intramembrane metalloprotease [Bacteroides sp.]MCM1390123.1 CPBP family intramembrane metalloprotease [Bacteroides sp.]
MFDPNLRVSAGKGLFLLVCWWVLLTVAGSLVMGAIGSDSTASLRWMILVQDLAVFILPVILTMLIVSSHPWKYIGIDTVPTLRLTGLTTLTAIISIPAMNRLVAWNESIHLPASWSGLESMLRDSENAAQAMVQQIMGGSTVWDLIAAILIVGVLTGIAEELFFRGGLQRLLLSKFGNKHLAIWSAAFIFSAVHLQFFGFFPRLLMGAYFGYLVVWSGSLRLSMFAHALNNSLVVLNFWLVNRNLNCGTDLNHLGDGNTAGSIIICIISLAASAGVIWAIWKNRTVAAK